MVFEGSSSIVNTISLVTGVLSVLVAVAGCIVSLMPGTGAVFGLLLTAVAVVISWFLAQPHVSIAYANNVMLGINTVLTNSALGIFRYHDTPLTIRLIAYSLTAGALVITYWLYRPGNATAKAAISE